MSKLNKVTKKTHAYILPEYSNVIVRQISKAHIESYQKDKKAVYQAPATKTVDGKKVESENFYVSVQDFVKQSASRSTKLQSAMAVATAGVDLTKMTAAELIAKLGL